jgi:UDP-glucose 4-epimerase
MICSLAWPTAVAPIMLKETDPRPGEWENGKQQRARRAGMKVLVTGGAGYIGSHTCVELAAQGHEVVIADNFANRSPKVVPRLEAIAGAAMVVHEVDIRDRHALARLFEQERIDAVIHFAALKAVGDSVSDPLGYFENNVGGSVALLQAMLAAGVNRFVFSSSCTVYGSPELVPVDESAPLRVVSPYGRTKLMVEEILLDTAASDAAFRHATLRYFNPVGAHPSGRIGEDPRGVPNNLMPFVCQVAIGRRAILQVNGDDYDTRDGTCIRDYLHVVDLAKAHVAALDYITEKDRSLTVNLGTGQGASVLEVVRAFEQATGVPIPYRIGPRREGGATAVWADPGLARRELGWRAELNLETMCRDAWRWQNANPNGYEG